MKRRGWLAILAAPLAWAQQWKECGAKPVVSICPPNAGVALNNQCPVCGTMAKPWAAQESSAAGWRVNIKAYRTVENGRRVEKLVEAAITRCEHCNSAFWQDKI